MKKARKIIITTVIVLVVAAVGYIAWFSVNNKTMPTHVLKDRATTNDTVVIYAGYADESISVVPAEDAAINDGIVNPF